ncbi:MAG: hypothetical protein ABIR96_03475 [Bdellovibrionota bacterium]
MALLSSSLILGGTLFISTSHPAFIKNTRAEVWFSDPQALSAQSMDGGLLLRAKDATTGLQAVGLDAVDGTRLTGLQNVSDENYAALTRCPQAPVSGSATGLLVRADTKDISSTLGFLFDCAFSELRLTEEQTQDQVLAKGLALKESEALAGGYRILSSSWQNGRRVLVIDEAQAAHPLALRRIFAGLFPFLEIRAGKSPRPGNTLIFEVTLFEFFRNAASKIGASWPESFRILNLEGDPFRKLNPALSLGLDFGESQGVAKVLARPQIRVKAGQKARFQSGGEFPVQLVTENVQTTQWKAYGLILDLGVPEDTRSGAEELSLDFKVELSEPDLSRGTESVPGLTMKRLESRFDLRVQETTVLSTMIQSRSGALRSGLAGLGSTPFLKHLFSTKSTQSQESELWFAIRPRWDERPWQEEDSIVAADQQIRKL